MQKEIERRIADYFGRKYCILVGSGTTALYVAFASLELEEGEKILYPDLTCETAINASIYAGLTPEFCDVDINTFNINIDIAIEKIKSEKISVIVPTHIFGHLIDIPKIQEELDKEEVYIIEDAAQAYGGELNDLKVGKMGHISIISFGKGKLLDCGGGGAILTDIDEIYYKSKEIVSTLYDDMENIRKIRSEFMKEYFILRKNMKDRREFIKRLSKLMIKYKDGYVYKVSKDNLENIINKFHSFYKYINLRQNQTSYLDEIFKKEDRFFLPYRTNKEVLWRYSFLINDKNRDKLYNNLISRGIKVSRLFEPVHKKYGYSNSKFYNSNHIYDRILNICFDTNMMEQKQILQILKEEFNNVFSR